VLFTRASLIWGRFATSFCAAFIFIMGRKSSQRRTPRRKKSPDPVVEEDLSDDASDVSTDTVAMLGLSLQSEDAEEQLKSKLAETLDDLTEKRAATRVQGLEKLTAILKMLPNELVEDRKATCLDTVLGLLRRAGEKEAVLACKALCVIFVHLGAENERVIQRVTLPLRRIATKGGSGSPRRPWALRALVVGCFICGEESTTTQALMRLCVEILQHSVAGDEVTPDLEIAALESWTLLATVESKPFSNKKAYAWHLNLFREKLSSSLADLRAAAGEAVAVIAEEWRDNPSYHRNPREVVEAWLSTDASKAADVFYESEKNREKREEEEEEERHQQFLKALRIAEEARAAARAGVSQSNEEAAGSASQSSPQPAATPPVGPDEEADEDQLVVPDVEAILEEADLAEGNATPDPETALEAESTGVTEETSAQDLAEAAEDGAEEEAANGGTDPSEDGIAEAPTLAPGVSQATSTEEGALDIELITAEIVERLQVLSTQSSKAMSRKARKVERRTFREIRKNLEDNETPVETLSFPNGDLSVYGYPSIMQLAAMRRILGSGLQRQLSTNPLLQEMFDIDEEILRPQEAGERMDALDKRLFVSKSSGQAKERTNNRQKERQARMNQKNLFMDADQA